MTDASGDRLDALLAERIAAVIMSKVSAVEASALPPTMTGATA